MFTASEIRKLFVKTPFQPFRFCMSDGSRFDVPHPEMMIVTRNFVEVPQGTDNEGVADSIARLAIIHISRIEDLQPA